MDKERQRVKGRYNVYVGVRVPKSLKDAVRRKAKEDKVNLGDAYRAAFKLYAGVAKLKPIKFEPILAGKNSKAKTVADVMIKNAKKRITTRKVVNTKLRSIQGLHVKKKAA